MGGESVGRSRRRDAKLWREAKRRGGVVRGVAWRGVAWRGVLLSVGGRAGEVGDGIDFYVCEKYKMMDINLLATSPCSLPLALPLFLSCTIYLSPGLSFSHSLSPSPSLSLSSFARSPHTRRG